MKQLLVVFLFCASVISAYSQKIDYSLVDREDFKEMNFEIIGKMGNNINIYKNNRNRHDISVYDNDMQIKNRIKLDFMPEKVYTVDFVSYGDFAYMIYQHQRRNIVTYSMVKINQDGKLMTDPVDLDTSHIGGNSDNKVYSMITSDDKKKIVIFKIKRVNDKNFQITSLLYNNQMELIKKTSFDLNNQDRDGMFTEFLVDNDGDFVFGRSSRAGNRDYINKIELIYKEANSDTVTRFPFAPKDITLDEVKLKIDNYNQKLILTSLFYQQRKGNIEGLYAVVWDKKTKKINAETRFKFNDSIRLDAKGENGSVKTAFNDYFIRQVIPVQDGGFAVAAELYNSSSRNSAWNRWDYLYGGFSPFLSPYDLYYNYPVTRMYGGGWYDPFNRFGPQNNQVRYVAENIMVFFFNADGQLRWSNSVRKSQYDDNSDAFISYQLFNTGNEVRFLFNLREKREQMLSSATMDAEGKVKRQPTLKNLDREYDFMPKFGKQIGLRQIVIPCVYKNYICFAKLEF